LIFYEPAKILEGQSFSLKTNAHLYL